ncbi:MAG TPA: hypothetical protein VK973_07575 [Arenicellales bacterium]|nr:hypothetical protein [Arenicellales bacterium]
MNRVPTIVLTPGEPAGIGPDLAALAPWTGLDCRVVIAADPELLSARAGLLGRAVDWPRYQRDARQPVSVLPVELVCRAVPGQLDLAGDQIARIGDHQPQIGLGAAAEIP